MKTKTLEPSIAILNNALTLIQQSGLTSEKVTLKSPMKTETSLKIFLQLCQALVGSTFQNTEDYSSASLQIIKWLTEPSKPGLMIYGTVGTGKTKIAKAICQLLEIYKQQYRAWLNENIVKLKQNGTYQHHDLTSERMPKAKFVIATDLKDQITLNDATKTSQIVVIDDLGLEEVQINNYGTKSSPFCELLSYRYEFNKPTIITTNLDDEKILERYGERIADRIHEMFSVIKLTGTSYRRL